MIIAMIHFLEFFRAKAFYYLNKLINPVLNIFVPLIVDLQNLCRSSESGGRPANKNKK
jgi:hypothetical protein